jgi:hypothetical protein
MIVANGAGALGTLFLRPGGWLLVIADLFFRSYSMFVGNVRTPETLSAVRGSQGSVGVEAT